MNFMNVMPVMGTPNCNRQSTPAFKASIESNIRPLFSKGIKEAFSKATAGEEGELSICARDYEGTGIVVNAFNVPSIQKLTELVTTLKGILENPDTQKLLQPFDLRELKRPEISQMMEMVMKAIGSEPPAISTSKSQAYFVEADTNFIDRLFARQEG